MCFFCSSCSGAKLCSGTTDGVMRITAQLSVFVLLMEKPSLYAVYAGQGMGMWLLHHTYNIHRQHTTSENNFCIHAETHVDKQHPLRST